MVQLAWAAYCKFIYVESLGARVNFYFLHLRSLADFRMSAGGGNDRRYSAGRTEYGVMRGAALMSTSSSAVAPVGSRSTRSYSTPSFAPSELSARDAYGVTNEGFPNSGRSARSGITVGATRDIASSGYSSTVSHDSFSAGGGFATGLYDTDRRSGSTARGRLGSSFALAPSFASSSVSSHARLGLSTDLATSISRRDSGLRTRGSLLRGNVGVAEDANLKCRPSMEDRYVICNPLKGVAGERVFLGVFDGHGGAGAADFAAEVIQHNFTNELKRADRQSLSITEVLTNTYHETDSQIAMAGVSRSSGCTAVCAYLHSDKGKRILHIANVGDSRAILCRNICAASRSANNMEVLTRDHKPSDPHERSRIEAAGGDVIHDRVQGMLAVSRALGDHSLNDFVVSTPEVRSTELGTDDEGFIMLACDGIFDVFTNDEAVTIIKEAYRERSLATAKNLGVQFLNPEQQRIFDVDVAKLLARDLVERAIQKGSRDNVTCLICLC